MAKIITEVEALLSGISVVRSAAGPFDEMSDVTGLRCQEPSMTDQSQAEDTDINVIAGKYGIGAELPVGVHAPVFGDFTGVRDFRTALEAVGKARDEFMLLPAHIRSTFDNDPQQFVEFASQPENIGQLHEWGMTDPARKVELDKLVLERKLRELHGKFGNQDAGAAGKGGELGGVGASAGGTSARDAKQGGGAKQGE